MSLETKKLSMLQLIMAIDSEEIIDQINSKIIQFLPNTQDENQATLLSKYAGTIEDKVDLDKIIKAQNYQGIDKKKMDMLAQKANIQESIDELLEMLD